MIAVAVHVLFQDTVASKPFSYVGIMRRILFFPVSKEKYCKSKILVYKKTTPLCFKFLRAALHSFRWAAIAIESE